MSDFIQQLNKWTIDKVFYVQKNIDGSLPKRLIGTDEFPIHRIGAIEKFDIIASTDKITLNLMIGTTIPIEFRHFFQKGKVYYSQFLFYGFGKPIDLLLPKSVLVHIEDFSTFNFSDYRYHLEIQSVISDNNPAYLIMGGTGKI